MDNLLKLVIYGLAFFMMLGVFIVLLPLLVITVAIVFAVERLFGIRLMKFGKLSEARRKWSPFGHRRPGNVPASEDIIDAEAIDLPDETPKQE
ncbi:MAG: hypothetical protein PHI35_00810 [Victivallaceae bacterium]|nr:hypothetical protein [Victivallaceae bacterium]